jgi:hypothetical protein
MAMEVVRTLDELKVALETLGFSEEASLNGMHLAEIEEEASNVLDLIISVRVHARHHDLEWGQGAVVNLTTALEHLQHHVQQVLPSLQKQLDVYPEDDEPNV